MDELFGKQMGWPRLVLKFGVEALLTYNFFHYATTEKADWDCFATDRRQPSPVDIDGAENMTAQFTSVIYTGFVVALIASCISFIEIINKKVGSKQLTVLMGILEMLVALVCVGWLVWAFTVRLSRNGKICAGATTNVTGPTKPYAYEQGQFLVVMLVIMTIMPVTLLVATNCGCL